MISHPLTPKKDHMVVAKTSIFYSTLLGGWCKEGFSLKMHEKGFLLILSCSHENSILVISYLSLAGCNSSEEKKVYQEK